MNIDQQQELDSREQIRNIVKQHVNEFGNATTIQFLSVLMLEYCHKHEWEHGEPIDLSDILKTSIEVAFWNASSEEED